MKTILASSSPRRHEILNIGGIKHIVESLPINEIVDKGKSETEIVKDLALQKAKPIHLLHPNDIVIGADTLVFMNKLILGKPKSLEDARYILQSLSGKTHSVITGVAIYYKDIVDSFSNTTIVSFFDISDEEISEYLQKENVLDKAGAYAIQGFASRYIKGIEGDYFNVMGLPLSQVYHHLLKIGWK
jgi:septum formation protein